MECALAGIPTLLIDREGWKRSRFYQLGENKIVFEDWPTLMDALMEHWKSREIPGFGIWPTSFLYELDPFRDGRAAERMGNYLHNLIQGFEKGLDRETILEETAQRYRKQWGTEKVTSIG